MSIATLPVVNVTVSKTTRLHFRWTEEQIEAMLNREVTMYLSANYTLAQLEKAKIDMHFGAQYQGGVEAYANVEIQESERQ